MYYYFLPEPPYFLLVVGLLVGITCGLAFEATLRQKAKDWLGQPEKLRQPRVKSALQLPFVGICLGISLFLGTGLQIFLLDPWLAYAIALPMTIFIAALVWIQLGKVLEQLRQGGSQAIDLDAF